MLKMVDGTGIIGLDMICPLGISTPQPPNYDRVEVEGTGILVLPNSLDAPLERLELGGKTEQVQTSGAQLLNKDNFFVNPPTTFDKLKYYPLNIGDKECTLSTTCPMSRNASNLFLLAGNIDKGASSSVNGVSFGISRTVKSQDGYVTIALRTIGDNPNNPLDYDIMLNYGSEAKPHEPYTGGKPSPSPEYPQEIKNVGKWNEGTQKYEVGVKLTGKNLFDKGSAKKGYEFSSVTSDMESPKEGWFVSDFIPVIGKVYISGKSTGSGCKLYNKDKVFVENIQAPSGALTIKEGISYFRLNGEIKDLDNVQVEYGSVATSYELYKKPQSLTLTSDRPLTKWDRLVEQGGQIGWLYGGKKYTVTGNEVFQRGAESYYTGSSTDMFYVIPDATGSEGIMKDLSFIKGIWNYTDKEAFCVNVNQLHIRLYNKRIGVSDDATMEEKFKAYKAFVVKRYADGTPFEVYYKTTKPEFVPLPEEEQNAIRALKTYYPTTVITADGGELDPDIKVTYRKEI